MTAAWLLFLVVDALVLMMGIYLVYASLAGKKDLTEPPTKWGRIPVFPYWYFEKLFGKGVATSYHVLIGFLFIVMALFGLAYFLTQQ
jgi:hypothetical protein